MKSVNVADTHAHNRSSSTRCHPTATRPVPPPARPHFASIRAWPRSHLPTAIYRITQSPTPSHPPAHRQHRATFTYQNKYKRSRCSHSLELCTNRRGVLRKLGRQHARRSVWHASVSLGGSAVGLTCAGPFVPKLTQQMPYCHKDKVAPTGRGRLSWCKKTVEACPWPAASK